MEVVWHDLECASYEADLPLWRELAARHGDPVLDIGAGTGRVALALAGHRVIALERDPVLAAELARRADTAAVSVLCADACAFALGQPCPLCIVPMQTIHLLADRGAFLRCAHAALRAGGVLAIALLGEGVEQFECELEPDETTVAGERFASTPLAVRAGEDGALTLVRRRESPTTPAHVHEQRLASVDAAGLEAEAHGLFSPLGRRAIEPTAEHAGSEIVLLRREP